GVGRIDIVENRLVGIKSRGCYETPGGTIMMAALRGVEQLVLDRDSFKWREQVGLEMSYVVYDGRWFAPLRQSLQAEPRLGEGGVPRLGDRQPPPGGLGVPGRG
ncbi:argininosuccinate synthase, partial [Mycobacterium tuberculosis]|nr:argininosuccinate synthase [Mycobacterium tuberculosis]